MKLVRNTSIATIAVSLVIFALGCGDSEDETNDGPNNEAFNQSQNISGCGGFRSVENGLTVAEQALTVDDETYCDAEVLHWDYTEANQRLELLNTRMELNCCGTHTMTAQEVDGVLVITEQDAPEGEGMRCGCTCVFDFGLVLEGVDAGERPVRIVRHVTDRDDGPITVYDGTISLDDGFGAIVISEQESMWCSLGEEG